MEQLSPAELLEFIMLHESVIDSQLQFWMTATFAIVVASFAARDVLTHRMRLIVSGLYLVATFVFASRWLYAVLDILVYATALSDIGITMLPVPWATENTSSVAPIAPPNAARSTMTAPQPSIMPSSAATAAPPELPRM